MTTPLSEPQHQEIQELLGAYALDAVDKETAEMIEQHLGECVRCTVEVAQHHEVAGLLANSGGSSPAALWEGIAARLDGSVPPSWEQLASRLPPGQSLEEPAAPGYGDDRTGDGDVVPIGHGRRRSPMVVRAVSLVAAAAAVVAIILGVQVDHLHHQVNALQSHPQLSAVEQSILRDPATKKVSLTALSSSGTHPAGAVTLVLTPSGTGFVEAGDLSSLPSDQTYQLWAVIGHQTISVGLLGAQPRVVPFSVAGGSAVSAFAITAEHAGGVVQSTHQPVVAGQVAV